MSKTTEQFADALALMMEAYSKLSKSSLSFKGEDDDEDEELDLEDDEETSISEELKAELITSTRDAIELIMDSEDHSSIEIAHVIAALFEAIQDIDPDVYGTEEFEEIEEDDDDDDDLFEDDEFDEDEDFEEDDED